MKIMCSTSLNQKTLSGNSCTSVDPVYQRYTRCAQVHGLPQSLFLTSFSRGHFQKNLFSFGNKIDLQITYLTSVIVQIFCYKLFSSCS